MKNIQYDKADPRREGSPGTAALVAAMVPAGTIVDAYYWGSNHITFEPVLFLFAWVQMKLVRIGQIDHTYGVRKFAPRTA